jgi:ribosomal protein S18 acetylase RimI-like enzyme
VSATLDVARNLVLRGLEPRDRPAVADLVASVELFSGPERLVAMEVVDAYMEHPGKDYHALGAFTPRDVLLGYACYGPTPCTSGTWDLYWIAVSGQARSRGVGTLLMEEIERRLVEESARLLLIETSSRADYARTRAFYERRGYRVVSRVPDFYAPGDDRVMFARTFHHGVTTRPDHVHVQLAADPAAKPHHRR